jgi:hypothetical protein
MRPGVRFIGKCVGVEQKNMDEIFCGKALDRHIDAWSRLHCAADEGKGRYMLLADYIAERKAVQTPVSQM